MKHTREYGGIRDGKISEETAFGFRVREARSQQHAAAC